MTTEAEQAQKKSKEQIEAEVKAERERRKKNRLARMVRRHDRRFALKKLGLKPNRKMTADKRTGVKLKGVFVDGTATIAADGKAILDEAVALLGAK